MPTVGWIQDTATDRFLERGLPDYGDERPTFTCRECGKEFYSVNERDRHQLIHPVANPSLFIGGRQVIGDNFKITQSITKTDIELAFVESVCVNGKALARPDELIDTLIATNNAFFDIELSRHGQPSKRVKIDIRLASMHELKRVDECFIRCVGSNNFNSEDLARFREQTSEFSDSNWYIDGLVHYLLGVLAKDRQTERLRYEEFGQCFNRALQNLSQYQTPLSQSVRSLIKFNLNDFERPVGATLLPALECALNLYNAKSGETKAVQLKSASQLPVDVTTSQILNEYCAYFSTYTLESLEVAINSHKSSGQSLQDRQKLLYLCYQKAVEEGNKKRQRDYGRKLTTCDVFNITIPDLEEIDE